MLVDLNFATARCQTIRMFYIQMHAREESHDYTPEALCSMASYSPLASLRHRDDYYLAHYGNGTARVVQQRNASFLFRTKEQQQQNGLLAPSGCA